MRHIPMLDISHANMIRLSTNKEISLSYLDHVRKHNIIPLMFSGPWMITMKANASRQSLTRGSAFGRFSDASCAANFSSVDG